jgi:23S rRNA pseudouridine1911/1915/1917 synthase
VKRLTLRVAEGDANERLDRFIADRGGISRGLARRALEAGGVFVDGRRCKVASRGVWPGQTVDVNLEEGGREGASAAPLEPSRLLFADEWMVAVDKPAGVPAQPTLTADRGTIADLAAALAGGAPRVVVPRLDLETSGVTVLARPRDAAAALSEAFSARTPPNTYLAQTPHPPHTPEGPLEPARCRRRFAPDPRARPTSR